MRCYALRVTRWNTTYLRLHERASSSERKNETDDGREREREREREWGRKFRGRRKTRLVVTVLSVCDARRGWYLRGECITRDAQHGKFAGNTMAADSLSWMWQWWWWWRWVLFVVVVCEQNRTNTLMMTVAKGCAVNALNTSPHKLFMKRIYLQKIISKFLRCTLYGE